MFLASKGNFSRVMGVLAAIGWIALPAGEAMANAWASSVGEARAVQNRTEDIVQRLNRTFPHCEVTLVASVLDNSACQLVEVVKCGGSWHQVQATLARTCSLAGQVNALVNADHHVRNDRRICDYLNDLSKRMERLRCSLDKDFARTQPKFCPPPVVSRFYGSQPGFNDPRYDSRPFDSQPFPLESVPEEVPSGLRLGPTEYRVQRPSSNPRGREIAQIGLSVLQQILTNGDR